MFLYYLTKDLEFSDIEPFSYTDVNLTSLDIGQSDPGFRMQPLSSSPLDHVLVHDMLLTLYDMVKRQLHDKGICSPSNKGEFSENIQQVKPRSHFFILEP